VEDSDISLTAQSVGSKEDDMSGNVLQDRYVKVGNINTRFWTAGTTGPSILMIHGLGGSVEFWQPNVGALGETHRVYALDLPGFGRSDKPAAPYSIPYFTRFVTDFLTSQGVERTHLVGNSLGGAIALAVAASRPDMVGRLVLVDPVGFGTAVHMMLRTVSLPLLGERVMRPSRKGIENMLKTLFLDPLTVTQEMTDNSFEIASLPGSGWSFVTTARSLFGFWGTKRNVRESAIDNARSLRCPSLIIWGKQDKILPATQARSAVKVIPNATLQLFDSSGHCPQLEQPAEFNSTVLRFLAE
jgi:pimeloyl-ACP methyl ester carboxylesterase